MAADWPVWVESPEMCGGLTMTIPRKTEKQTRFSTWRGLRYIEHTGMRQLRNLCWVQAWLKSYILCTVASGCPKGLVGIPRTWWLGSHQLLFSWHIGTRPHQLSKKRLNRDSSWSWCNTWQTCRHFTTMPILYWSLGCDTYVVWTVGEN